IFCHIDAPINKFSLDNLLALHRKKWNAGRNPNTLQSQQQDEEIQMSSTTSTEIA
ncbi:hypothetical protein L9F63_001936, partial [Diploptera punctata]